MHVRLRINNAYIIGILYVCTEYVCNSIRLCDIITQMFHNYICTHMYAEIHTQAEVVVSLAATCADVAFSFSNWCSVNSCTSGGKT